MAQELPRKTPNIQAHIDDAGPRYMAARKQMEEHGIQIRHVRPLALTRNRAFAVQNGGMTVAFRQRKGETFVEVATAICSLKDTYSRKVGTALAVEAFMNERVIRLPNYDKSPAVDLVELVFGDSILLLADD